MFSYISLEERVPALHPLRKLRAVVDALLATMNREFEAVYARRGRPSVPPEMLLKALLLQICFPSAASASWSKRSTTTCSTAGS
jgi:transposase